MKTIEVNGLIVKLYDSIEELPIINFQKYNKFMLIDSIVGSNVSDVDLSILKAIEYIKMGANDFAITQLDNVRHAVHLVNEELSPRFLAFTALIQSINGKSIQDLSDNNLMQVQNKLLAVKVSTVELILSHFKKKVESELSSYFPKLSNNTLMTEVFVLNKRLVIAKLDSLLTDDDAQVETIQTEVERRFLNISKPKPFTGIDSFEIQYDKQFNELCVHISKATGIDPETLTVFKFYSTLEYIDKHNS